MSESILAALTQLAATWRTRADDLARTNAARSSERLAAADELDAFVREQKAARYIAEQEATS